MQADAGEHYSEKLGSGRDCIANRLSWEVTDESIGHRAPVAVIEGASQYDRRGGGVADRNGETGGGATHGFAILKQSLEGDVKGMKEELSESTQFKALSAEKPAQAQEALHGEGLRRGHRVPQGPHAGLPDAGP